MKRHNVFTFQTFKFSILLFQSVVAAVLLYGCAHKSTSSKDEFSLRIIVEHLPKRDAWKVTFQPSQPVSNLVFDRQINRFRAKTWKPLTEGVTVVEKEGREQISSKNSEPFQQASFEFESYYEMTPKDYEFFQAFSDGSVVMYTGHMNACPENIDCKRAVEFQLIPTSSERGIVAGRVFSEPLLWSDDTWRGTYVYFGKLNFIETKSLTAIVDPALPKWLHERFHSLLPRLFDYYAERTGHPLTFKPFIFLNYSSNGEGNSYHGGTLPGLIQLSMSGKGWSHYDNEAFVDMARFLAHESAHVWNGQLFPYASGDMWMHEGGADAFAYFALHDLKIIDNKGFLGLQTEAFNGCLSMLKNRALMDVNEDPSQRAHYRCGAILGLLTHSAVMKSKNRDLFYFWNQLFSDAKTRGLPYSEEMYFSVLDRLAGNTQFSTEIKTFLRGPIKEPQELLLRQFQTLGIQTRKFDRDLPREYKQRVGMDVLRFLMKQDCSGKYGLSGGRDGVETEGFEKCSTFKQTFYVTHLLGFALVKDGAKAFDAVRAACSKGEKTIPVTVRGKKENLSVMCPQDAIPARSAYTQILKIPVSRNQ